MPVRRSFRAGPTRRLRRALPLTIVVVLGVVVGAAPLVQAASSPPLYPRYSGSQFLGNLSLPSVPAGQSTTLAFSLSDPLPSPMIDANLTLQFYAFNAYPGNATGPLPANDAPFFASGHSFGNTTFWTVASIAPGATTSGAVTVESATGTPSGTYAVRTLLVFAANGTHYRLASVGWFTRAQLLNATLSGNGTSGPLNLNLSRLGISALLPETAFYVQGAGYSAVLYGLLGAAFVALGVGAYVSMRRASKSRSGARGPDPPSHAPRAFGARRTSDGD